MKSPSLVFLLVFWGLVACTHQPRPSENRSDSDASMSDSKANASSRNPAARREGTLPPNQLQIAEDCALPASMAKVPDSIYLKHRAMWINYNPRLRNPNWVYHELYRENLQRACFKRPGPGSGPFGIDPQLKKLLEGFNAQKAISIINSNSYKNTGFDRGHLAPNADFAHDNQAQVESFYMSNMMPQQPDVNQQTWAKLENRIRNLACGMGHVRVYTGPIYSKPPMGALKSCAMVPEAYYKALLAIKNGQYYGIAFIYSQDDRVGANLDVQPAKGDISGQRVVSIAEVEDRTGIPLFTEFSEDLQRYFKSQKDLSRWTESASCYKELCKTQGLPPDERGEVTEEP